MTRPVLATALAALLSGNCPGWAQPSSLSSPREQMRAIGPDSPVEVKFLDGGTVAGIGVVLAEK